MEKEVFSDGWLFRAVVQKCKMACVVLNETTRVKRESGTSGLIRFMLFACKFYYYFSVLCVLSALVRVFINNTYYTVVFFTRDNNFVLMGSEKYKDTNNFNKNKSTFFSFHCTIFVSVLITVSSSWNRYTRRSIPDCFYLQSHCI